MTSKRGEHCAIRACRDGHRDERRGRRSARRSVQQQRERRRRSGRRPRTVDVDVNSGALSLSFGRAAEQTGVPRDLLVAIARVEDGLELPAQRLDLEAGQRSAGRRSAHAPSRQARHARARRGARRQERARAPPGRGSRARGRRARPRRARREDRRTRRRPRIVEARHRGDERLRRRRASRGVRASRLRDARARRHARRPRRREASRSPRTTCRRRSRSTSRRSSTRSPPAQFPGAQWIPTSCTNKCTAGRGGAKRRVHRHPRHRGRLGRERRDAPERPRQERPVHRRHRRQGRAVRHRGHHRVARRQLLLQPAQRRHRARRLLEQAVHGGGVRGEREARRLPREEVRRRRAIARTSSVTSRSRTARRSRSPRRRAATRRRTCEGEHRATAAPTTTPIPASGSGRRTCRASAARRSATTSRASGTARTTRRRRSAARAARSPSRPATAPAPARSKPNGQDDVCHTATKPTSTPPATSTRDPGAARRADPPGVRRRRARGPGDPSGDAARRQAERRRVQHAARAPRPTVGGVGVGLALALAARSRPSRRRRARLTLRAAAEPLSTVDSSTLCAIIRGQMSTDAIRFFAATDVGNVREHNEDNFLVDKKLVALHGRRRHGRPRRRRGRERASRSAPSTRRSSASATSSTDFVAGARGASRVTNKDILALLEHAVQRACSRIHEEAQADPQKRGMGTTLSALLVLGTRGFIAHVGDSRIYLARGGARAAGHRGPHGLQRAHQARQAHARADREGRPQERHHARGRRLRARRGRHADDRGAPRRPVPPRERRPHRLPRDHRRARAVPRAGRRQRRRKALIELAKARGGKDNITVVLVRLGGEATRTTSAPSASPSSARCSRRMPLFARLSDRELLRVMQVGRGPHLRRRRRSSSARATRATSSSSCSRGKVSVSRGGETLTRLGAGEHFGEMALIRAVPRSATVNADGGAELIAIRRTDFFEILRKEHEIAVKMLWQFLGVLADRLDQTSSELRHAKQELHADDDHRRRDRRDLPRHRGRRACGPFRAAVERGSAAMRRARSSSSRRHRAGLSTETRSASADARARSDRGACARARARAARRVPRARLRSRATRGDAPAADLPRDGQRGRARPPAPTRRAGSTSRPTRASPCATLETGRELRFEGPGRVRACADDVALVAEGSAIGLPGSGEAPGAEQWAATACGVARWASGVHRFAGARDACKLQSSLGSVHLYVAGDVTADGGRRRRRRARRRARARRRCRRRASARPGGESTARRALRAPRAAAPLDRRPAAVKTALGACERAAEDVQRLAAAASTRAPRRAARPASATSPRRASSPGASRAPPARWRPFASRSAARAPTTQARLDAASARWRSAATDGASPAATALARKHHER